MEFCWIMEIHSQREWGWELNGRMGGFNVGDPRAVHSPTDFVDFHFGPGRLPYPEKYPLTVIAFGLFGQFRLVNIVLPFRHLGCLWISRVDKGFQGNLTNCLFHRNTYTSSHSHSQAHWPRWRRPPTIESSSRLAQAPQDALSHGACWSPCIITRDVTVNSAPIKAAERTIVRKAKKRTNFLHIDSFLTTILLSIKFWFLIGILFSFFLADSSCFFVDNHYKSLLGEVLMHECSKDGTRVFGFCLSFQYRMDFI